MCNCQIVNNDGDNEIEYCPLHAAAEQMLEAAKEVVSWHATRDTHGWAELRAAIAAAEPDAAEPFTGEVSKVKVYPGKVLSPEEILKLVEATEVE